MIYPQLTFARAAQIAIEAANRIHIDKENGCCDALCTATSGEEWYYINAMLREFEAWFEPKNSGVFWWAEPTVRNEKARTQRVIALSLFSLLLQERQTMGEIR